MKCWAKPKLVELSFMLGFFGQLRHVEYYIKTYFFAFFKGHLSGLLHILTEPLKIY